MSKLPKESRFLDVSDYARPVATRFVALMLPSPVTSIHITFAFLVTGLLGLVALHEGYTALAAFLLILKNMLDAADGEMARKRSHPMLTGRYLDSIFDFVINLGLFFTLYIITDTSLALFIISFLCLELQCSIFNYYYLIQRTVANGDQTSKIDEFKSPVAYPYENQQLVNVLHKIYLILYGLQDKVIYWLDGNSHRSNPLPNWFMTAVSFFGLGFQFLIIAVLLFAGKTSWIIPFFIIYMFAGFGVILIRRVWMKEVGSPEMEVEKHL